MSVCWRFKDVRSNLITIWLATFLFGCASVQAADVVRLAFSSFSSTNAGFLTADARSANNFP